MLTGLLAKRWCKSPKAFVYNAAAAAKSLQSCPTLCDPIDSSPPASSVHGILQARTLEWAAISSSIVYNRFAERKPGLDKGQGLLTLHDSAPPIFLYVQLRV